MKIVKSSVSILPQEPGVDGLMKHVEKLGRIAYLSEDRMTEDSWEKFDKMLYNRGHWTVFNSGTVYLDVPVNYGTEDLLLELERTTSPYTKICYSDDNNHCYLTTNLRVIYQKKLEDFMNEYWCEPTEYHYHRVTSVWVCSRGIQTELVRHRIMSFVAESTRYVGYNKGRYGGELTYILPQWIYRVRNNIGNTVDSLTGLPRNYILDLDGQDLWDHLTVYDRTVASRDRLWREIENEYLYETTTDEGEKLKPEEARGGLCNDLKSVVGVTGYIEDFIKEPEEDTLENEGFFHLRCAKNAHLDMQILANDLKQQFIDTGLYNLK